MSSEAAPRHCEGNDQPTLEERVAGLQKELAKQRDDFQEQLAKQCDDSEKQRDVFQKQLAKQRDDFQEQLAAFQERHDASQQQAAKFEKELGESMRRTRLTQERLRATANRRISCELSRVFVALTAATAHAKPSTKNRRKKAGAAESTPSSQGSPPRSARGRSAPNGDSAAAASPAANASDTNSDGRSTASPHRTNNGGGGGESQVRVDARAEIIKTGCRPFPDFDEGTFMCAHLVKKEFLKYLTTAEEPLPDVLTATARLLGPYGARTPSLSAGRDEQAPPGAALLTWSVRNILCMPKAMEVSMDKGEWVLEPVLPEDVVPQDLVGTAQAAECMAAGWEPTLWRVKCLVPADVSSSSAEEDQTEIDMRLQHDNHKLATVTIVPDSCGRRRMKRIVTTQDLVPLSHFRNRTVTFDWNRVSMRALVVVYLFTLWNHVESSGVQNYTELTAGIARVWKWMKAIRKRQPAAGMEQQEAPSLERIKEWFATLDVDGLDVDGALDEATPPPSPHAVGGHGDDGCVRVVG